MVQFALEELADPRADHFARLKLERDPAVCPSTLEIRYLRASRIVHPDRVQAMQSAANGPSAPSGSGGDATSMESRGHAASAQAPECPVTVALEASALLNEAQRILAQPWERYPYLAELLVPGVMEATKQLDPMFLMEAMELGERVDDARRAAAEDPQAAIRLKKEIEGQLIDYARQVEERLRDGDEAKVRDAARLCHEAKYFQRALEILERLDDGGIPD
jgi:hypothetical protein